MVIVVGRAGVKHARGGGLPTQRSRYQSMYWPQACRRGTMRLVSGSRVAAMTGTAVNRLPPLPVKTDGRCDAIVSNSGDPRP